MRQGIGFTLLSRGAIAAELKRGELAAWPLRPRAAWKLAMLSYANLPRTDIQQAFMRTARQVARELTQSNAWPGRFLAGR